MNDDTLSGIGERYGKAASQERLEENIVRSDFKLTAEEIQEVFELQGGLVDRVRDRIGL